MTTHDPSSPFASAPNFRDLGGLLTRQGSRLRRGRVFRSQVLAELDEQDLGRLQQLGIGAYCDLRGHSEAERRGNRWPAGRQPQAISPPREVLAPRASPVEWVRALSDPGFDPRQAQAWMLELYERMPGDFAPHLAVIARYLAHPDAQPLLIHCEAGKDRTGFTCAVLLLALGVDEAVVYADYLRSAEHYRAEALLARAEHWLGAPLPPSGRRSLDVLAGVQSEFLKAALDRMQKQHGDARGYLLHSLDGNAALLSQLAARLLE